jgi:hypothetical protein
MRRIRIPNLNTANPSYPELNGANNNPAYDAWNKYGDESNNAITLNGVDYQGKSKPLSFAEQAIKEFGASRC